MSSLSFEYGLTEHERSQYKEQGFIMVKGALDKDLVSEVINDIDGCNDKKADEFCFLNNCPSRSKALLNLIDHPSTVMKVVDILGWNIFLSHSHINITPYCGVRDDKSLDHWHLDLRRVSDDTIECDPAPMISVKIAYYLTDQTKGKMGNLLVVPGSHLSSKEPDFKKQIEVICEPGDAIVFDRRLWHTAGSNCSDVTRKAVFYQYSYRWMRPHDVFSDEFVEAVDDPIRKQLLGHYGSRDTGYSYYQPSLDDAPLQLFLKNKGE